MPNVISQNSLDTSLDELLRNIDNGLIQLPEFQRGWRWDNDHIRAILASLTQGYPMGAVMRLQCGGEARFKARPFEGVKARCKEPEYLVLDGQQRLTSMYRALRSKEPVLMPKDRATDPDRGFFYYLNIEKCLDSAVDRLDAVVAVPEEGVIRTNFNREVVLDLSTREKEWEAGMFPLNIVFDTPDREAWLLGYLQHGGFSDNKANLYTQFRQNVLDIVFTYKLPVITLARNTPKEAVCKVFEHVNTGGVVLTVFELVTASFAAGGLDLRADWEACSAKIWGQTPAQNSLMLNVKETEFLSAVTLYSIASKNGWKSASCKRKDILSLSIADYNGAKDPVLQGFNMAETFLGLQCVFQKGDLPYSAQLVPLAVICAAIGSTMFYKPNVQTLLSQWYWCGVLGEMYGSANETRYANDVVDVVTAVTKDCSGPVRTIDDAFFSSTRLLTLWSRRSAAYKGFMALICRNGAKDFYLGTNMGQAKGLQEFPDIHHLFPVKWCDAHHIDPVKKDSIVNKTPILLQSNRAIGGAAPSAYSSRIIKEAKIDEAEMENRIDSHLVDWNAFKTDNFDDHFIARAKRLLDLVEKAMGKQVGDRNSNQTIERFGTSLVNAAPTQSGVTTSFA